MKLLRNFSIYKTSHFFLLTFFMCRWYACLRIWPTQFYTVGVRWIGPHSVRKYGRISLIRTAEGQFWESILWMCLYYRGRDYMHSGFSGTKWTVHNLDWSLHNYFWLRCLQAEVQLYNHVICLYFHTSIKVLRIMTI